MSIVDWHAPRHDNRFICHGDLSDFRPAARRFVMLEQRSPITPPVQHAVMHVENTVTIESHEVNAVAYASTHARDSILSTETTCDGGELEQEQIREYRHLQDELIAKLRQHAFVDDLNASHVFQYLILPSFTPPIAWDVFRRRRQGYADDYLLVRSSWRSDLDLEKLRTPVERVRHPYPLAPTIEAHQLNAPSGELARLAAELTALELPIGAPPGVGGVDGVTYEVAIEQPPHYIALAAKCRLSWWHEPPAQWAALSAWVQRAERVFDSAWAARGDSAPTPLRIKAIDDAAARHEAQRLFHAGKYGPAADLLADVSTREKLTLAESKMLELALKRVGGGRA